MTQNNHQPAVSRAKYASIPLRILAYIAWRNLVHKKLRALLTMFGIIIGIGAIFFLLSFGIGLQHLVTEQVIGNQSIKSIEVETPNSRILKLDDNTLNKLRHLPHVLRIGASYSFPGSLKFQGSEIDVVSTGVDMNYQSLSSLALSYGRLLTADDYYSIVLNEAALRAINIKDSKSVIGKKVMIRIPLSGTGAQMDNITAEFEIAGVVSIGSGSEIFLPNRIFQTAGVPAYGELKLEAVETNHVNPLRKQIESLGLQTTSPIDTIDEINRLFKFFNFMLVGFGAIGMIVAVLGMFNTLTISLLERTKEIGLMIALGGRNRDMRKLFIFEAVLLSVAGAVIGIILASTGGVMLNYAMNTFAARRGVTEPFDLFATPPVLILGTIGFMLLVGLAVVYMPARRAERINPIDALRRE